jgi:hypothetical protein
MMNTRTLLFIAPLMLAVGGSSGCCRIFDQTFAPGSYGEELACSIGLVDSSGASSQAEFTSPATVTVDPDGGFSVNGVELFVGQSVTRSIPTADLAFEVTAITNADGLLTVTLEPRPTLPGITIEGELVERYRWECGSVSVSSSADLIVTDVSAPNDISVDCDGVLQAQEAQ